MNEKEALQDYLQQNVLSTSLITEKYGISKQLLSHYVKHGAIAPILETPLGNFYLKKDVELFMKRREENEWDLLAMERGFNPDILAEPDHGVTEKSLQFFAENRSFLGEIEGVTLYQFPMDAILHGAYRTSDIEKMDGFYALETPHMTIRDTEGKTIWLFGCNCGYLGTGPRGSETLLKKFGVPQEEIEKLFYHSVIHYCRREDGTWITIALNKGENPSNFRLHGDRIIVQKGNTLVMMASDDAKAFRGMSPEVFLKPYAQFIPDPVKAVLMPFEQARDTGHVVYSPYSMTTKVYNLVIKDSSGRELWLAVDRSGFPSAKTQRTIRELLEGCGFELDETPLTLSEKLQRWLGLQPINSGTIEMRIAEEEEK